MNDRESDDEQIVAEFCNDVMHIRAQLYVLKIGSNI